MFNVYFQCVFFFQSNKIENYFTPTKTETKQQYNITTNTPSNLKSAAAVMKEIENLDDFFEDDDDAFKEIVC